MSARTKSRTPAQAEMARIITIYVQHIMELQAGTSKNALETEITPPNDSFPSFDFFCAEFVPGISLEKYAQRLVTYMKCTSEAFIFALAYIRRFLNLGFPLHSRSIHRVLLTSMVVAAKTRDDLYCSMSYYAQVGGVSNRDLNMMELRLLADLLDFRAEVPPDEYRTVCNAITAVVSMDKVSSDLSELCGVTASNTPTEFEKKKESQMPSRSGLPIVCCIGNS
ncbi:cyclin [Trypanosoma rangeli]|uniref:Cyclin n=1 Tax=Trypanosoma rangeli TaxID=5698 RepID=A0A3R7RLR0_TRYRA|nr:cyclin [Trypanosoma rangeli]RNF06630.1 cyclin [Trypanosoma rangeli]|eukprot:RNF06630.1 cyclin [Trypanosoma rangeli]